MFSSKQNSTASRGLPKFREKLSSLVRQTSLRGYGKKLTKATIDATPEPVPKRTKKPEKAAATAKVQDKAIGDLKLGEFKPFDFDLDALESFRLSQNWLETQRIEQQSSTPIADTFSRPSIQVERPSLQHDARNTSRPIERPAIETTALRAPTGPARIANHASRAESKHIQPTPINIASTTQARINVAVPSRASSLRREIGSMDEAVNGTPRHAIREVSLLKPVGYSDTPAARTVSQTVEKLNSNKRHSMPAAMPSALGNRRSVADIKYTLNSRSTSTPQDRRLSLQPASPAPATSSSTSQPTLSRRASSRLASDRLAWIKELEEGKNGAANPGRDFVLKNLQGGVADKLAKFENKQLTGGLTRTNSTISRISADAYGIESSYGSTMTRSSTLDTSNRASSVLTNFDDSFREKMEILAGNLANKANEESSTDPKALGRVTSKFEQVGIQDETKQDLPKEVTDFAILSDGDPETTINDITRHGNLGRTLTWNETDIVKQLNDAADRALTEDAEQNSKTATVSEHRQTTPSTAATQLDSSPRRTKNSNMTIKVAEVSPPTPTRITMDINSPPCAATFSTLSSEGIPLAKDEHTPGESVPMSLAEIMAGDVETPKAASFNAATMPVFAHS